MLPIILSNTGSEIKWIYHLSDIHIRNLKRHEEYVEVFEKVYAEIKESQSLIVLTGDIMHSKTELSPEAIVIACNFFEKLSQLAPVILIAGNHDCIITNKDRLDALTPLYQISKLENFHYLKDTGFYQYRNIIFGLTDLFSKKLLTADSLDRSFYDKISYPTKWKIALYHGQIRKSKTESGYEIKSYKFRTKDFHDYDYVLLGDIHHHQYLDKKKTIAYAGSLIQQSHGESLNSHGILLWDLTNGKSRLIPIENQYGFCQLHIVNGVLQKSEIPLKPHIKFYLHNTTPQEYEKIEKGIMRKYQVINIMKENVTEKFVSQQREFSFQSQSYLQSYFRERFSEKDNLLLEKLHQKISQKVKIEESRAVQNSWKILELRFSNIFSYGEDNVIDFRKYNRHCIIGIFAPNHYGKSAIVDIILFCLFDKCTRGKALDILNKDKKYLKCSLLFQLGKREYLVERKYSHSATRGKNCIYLSMLNGGEKIHLDGSSVKETNSQILKLVGNYEDYLISFIYPQQDTKFHNFLEMTQLQKKEYLYGILHIHQFDHYYQYAYEKVRTYEIKCAQLRKEVSTNSASQMKKKLKKKRKILDCLLEEKEEMEKFHQFCKTPQDERPQIYYRELDGLDLSSGEKIRSQISQIRSQISQYDQEKLSRLRQDYQLLRESLQGVQKERENRESELAKYRSEITKIPENVLKMNYPQMTKYLDSLQEKLQKYEKGFSREVMPDMEEILNGQRSKRRLLFQKIEKDQEELSKMALPVLPQRNAFLRHVRKTLSLLSVEDYPGAIRLQKECLAKRQWDFSTEKMDPTEKIQKIQKNMEKMVRLSYEIFRGENQRLQFLRQVKRRKQIEETRGQLESVKGDIQTYLFYEGDLQQNILTQEKIGAIEKDLSSLSTDIKKIEESLKILEEQIGNLARLEEGEKHCFVKLKFLKLYYLYSFGKDTPRGDRDICWSQEKIIYFLEKIGRLKSEIHYLQIQLDQHEMKEMKLIDAEKKLNLYRLYQKIMDYNGIPYEILKEMLPFIQKSVNKILQEIVDFQIEFYFHQEEKQKTNLGNIYINLCRHTQKYQMTLASGFEKFIVGLAMRVVLCHISKSAKPNFFIIDEGWSCLDPDNINNLDEIMNYLKDQFEYVIMITHLEVLKGQADYLIPISKSGGYSRIQIK